MQVPQKKKKNLKALEAIADYPTNTQGVYDVAEEFVQEDCKENTKDSHAKDLYEQKRHGNYEYCSRNLGFEHPEGVSVATD